MGKCLFTIAVNTVVTIVVILISPIIIKEMIRQEREFKLTKQRG